jgi:hypothetical protein
MQLPLIFAFAVCSFGQTGLRTQVVVNGGFEDGLAGWQPDPRHQLVDNQSTAHTGNRCLFGEVTQAKDACVLKQQVQVRANKLYEFEIWARATNGTKLVLWITGEGQRRMVQAWQNVPEQWQRYTAVITFERSGATVLEVVAPSSHDAPPGKMWIDDIALYEYDVPLPHDVSANQGFNDFPTAVCTRDGSVWVAWLSFRDGKDTLQTARAAISGDRVTVTSRSEVEIGADPYVLDPGLATDGENVWLVYSAEKAGNWEVFAVRLGQDGPLKPLQVTRHPAVDVKPACVVQGNRVWVAWESNRDRGWRQIYLARIEGQRVSKEQRVSAANYNNYAPSVAADKNAPPLVVWYSFRHGNFDLYAYDARDPEPRERRLTTAASIDRDPRVIWAQDGPWLAWDNANSVGYHIGAVRTKRVCIARVSAQGLEAPVELEKTPLWDKAEFADLTFDAQGRLWVSFRQARGRAGWDVAALCYGGGMWSDKLRIAVKKGLARRSPIVFAQGRVLVCYQGDDIPDSWSSVQQSAGASSGVFIACVNASEMLVPAGVVLTNYKEPTDAFEPAAIRIARGEDGPRRHIEYQGRSLNLYFGDLHEHTDISVCNRTGDQTQDQSYQSMRDVARYDFAALTDHGYNFNAYFWAHTAKVTRANNDPGRFLTFLAEEWTSSFETYTQKHPYGYYGHRNLVLENPYFPFWFNARDGKTPAEVWEILRRAKASFIHIPHQLADVGNVPTDWEYVDEVAQPVAEIFQTRGSYEYEGAPRQARNTTPRGWFLQDAWARGVVIGVIASPDHGGGYGKAAVYAPELTRKAILQAIRQRHTYGTTGAKIALDVRVNGHLMGEKGELRRGEPVRVEIRAWCPSDIERVEICRNNQFIYTPAVKDQECNIIFVDNDPPDGSCYYYVRVIQKDQEIAWSSPVWLGQCGPM